MESSGSTVYRLFSLRSCGAISSWALQNRNGPVGQRGIDADSRRSSRRSRRSRTSLRSRRRARGRGVSDAGDSGLQIAAFKALRSAVEPEAVAEIAVETAVFGIDRLERSIQERGPHGAEHLPDLVG